MHRRGFTAFALSTGAVVWSALLIVGAFTVGVYRGERMTIDGVETSFSSTLVEVNGTSVLIPVSIPLLLTCIVFLALWRTCTTGSTFARNLALVLACLLGFFAFLGMATIGFFLLPAALLAILAVPATPDPLR